MKNGQAEQQSEKFRGALPLGRVNFSPEACLQDDIFKGGFCDWVEQVGMYVCEFVISKKFNKVMNDPGAANLHLHMIVMSNEQAYSTYNTNGCIATNLTQRIWWLIHREKRYWKGRLPAQIVKREGLFTGEGVYTQMLKARALVLLAIFPLFSQRRLGGGSCFVL